MKTYHKSLGHDEIQLLQKHFKSLRFKHDFSLVYENQIPNTGIVLLKGKMDLKKKDETQLEFTSATLLGVNQLLSQKTLRHECVIQGQSEVILISKSELLEIQKNHPELSSILLS